MKYGPMCALSILFLGFLSASALAAEGLSGALVTQMQGSASLLGKEGKTVPVKAFAKVHAGDRINLSAGAKLQLVYLNGGRQETWTDAAQLDVGSTETRQVGPGKPPLVNTLPPHLLQTLTRSPDVIASIQNRQGMVRLRSVLADTHLADARKQYEEMRQAVSADDITPELHFLVNLDRLKAYGEIKEVLKEMMKRQPDNPEIKALYDHYSKS